MKRVIVGLIKGAIVGGGVGYGLLRLGWTSAVWVFVACAVVGALVGLVCGRAPWRSETLVTPMLKMIVGAAVGLGLCWLGRRFLPQATLFSLQGHEVLSNGGSALSVGVGLLYGLFVEVDDGGKPPEDKKTLPAERPRLKA